MAISAVNTSTWYTIGTIHVPTSNPSPNGTQQREWISNVVYVPSTGLLYATVIHSISVPYNIFDLSFLYSINPQNGSIMDSIALDNYASGLAYDSSNGMLYAASAIWNINNTITPSSSFINAIDPSSMKVVSSMAIPGLNLKQIEFNSLRNQLYIPIYNGHLTVLNTTTGTMVNTTTSPGIAFAPTYVAYSRYSVYVASVASQNISVVNETAPNSTHYIHTTVTLATSAAYDPGTHSLFISDMNGIIYRISPATSQTTERLSIGTTTQALIYNSHKGQIYAVGSGSKPYVSVLGNGPPHTDTFRLSGIFPPSRWTVVANGVPYSSSNGSISFSTSGNITQYHVNSNSPYLIIPWAGTITGGSGSSVDLLFINLYTVVVAAIAVTLAATAVRLRRKRRISG